MEAQNKNIVLFGGGRGTDSLVKGLKNTPNINVSILVNGYDDGLSTGHMREIAGPMLGPSDFRKNIARLASISDYRTSKIFSEILEYRFSKKTNNLDGLKIVEAIIHNGEEIDSKDFYFIKEKYAKLTIQQGHWIRKCLSKLLEHLEKENKLKDIVFADMSIGNLLLAGAHISNSYSFNQAIREMSSIAEIDFELFNITRGEPLVLCGLTKKGNFLPDEASIVSRELSEQIDEIFLVETESIASLKKIILDDTAAGKSDHSETLRECQKLPQLSKEAKTAIENADIIIYGSGTQHSSLYPSYMTRGLANTIAKNTKAYKIFLGNISRDADLVDETQTSIINKFFYYMGLDTDRKNLKKIVDTFLIHDPNSKILDSFHKFDISKLDQELIENTTIIQKDLEFDKGKHSTSRTLRELISIINDHFESPAIKFSTNLVSIIVPVLDEVRTISTVLDSLISLKKKSKLYSYEIICVDGGSNDGTKEILEKYETQVAIINSSEFGKGICVREGLKKAHGDIIVLFPGDLEYSTKDIEKIVQSLKNQEFGMSIGTRAYDSKDLNNRLISVYNKKSLTYYLSKYGGLMISLVFLLKYQRIVSDPLSSVKAFNIRVIREMKFKSTGFDFDIELISELFKTKNVLLEVPVSYNARSVDQGKKMVAKEGLSCLMRVLFH